MNNRKQETGNKGEKTVNRRNLDMKFGVENEKQKSNKVMYDDILLRFVLSFSDSWLGFGDDSCHVNHGRFEPFTCIESSVNLAGPSSLLLTGIVNSDSAPWVTQGASGIPCHAWDGRWPKAGPNLLAQLSLGLHTPRYPTPLRRLPLPLLLTNKSMGIPPRVSHTTESRPTSFAALPSTFEVAT